MLKERQKSILSATISEHLRTARPVASQELVYGFGLKVGPATVRSEMLRLDKLGYLEQPYTSAGRVPTDKGYRFFVDNLLEDIDSSDREQKLIRKMFRNLDGEKEFVKELSKTISQLTGSLTAAGMFDDEVFYESGFSEVLKEPEFKEAAETQRFGRLVDSLEKNIREFFEDFDKETEQIFIGEENPIKEAQNCTMTISSWEHPRGFKGFISTIGPKRTDYHKKISLIRYVKDL